MTISYNWLTSYLTEAVDIDVLTDTLTSIGLEVDGCQLVQQVKGGLQGVVIGEVLAKTQHPDADRLSVTVVDIGRGEPLQIVCGAPNVAAGQKVAVATIGTTIYPTEGDPLTMKKSKIRGVESYGMICAEDELGLGNSHDGILVLNSHAPVGQEAATYFQLHNDYQIEIGLTPNRADAQSHIGVAEDVAAALVARGISTKKIDDLLKYPTTRPLSRNNDTEKLPITVEVVNKTACPRYAGIALSGITVADSPAWLRERLLSIGVRPINNIVDITNFVLHEMGQPLHAFDYDTIGKNTVVVQYLSANTPFISLDDQQRSLHDTDLIICDGNEQPMCLAGVFGGATTGVTNSTTRLFLEAAYFEPKGIRQTATKHNLRTDASRAFEKGVDPNAVLTALTRAASLIIEIAGGRVASDVIDIKTKIIENKTINLRYSRLNAVIGNTLAPETVKNILAALRMPLLSETTESLTVSVPTNKPDVTREIDLVEEILRMYGLNNLELDGIVKSTLTAADRTESYRLRNIIGDTLAAQGFNEIMGLSLTQSRYFEEILPMPFQFMVFINNTTNKGLDVMRPTLIFSSLEAVLRNQNRQNADLKFFEFGKIYTAQTASIEPSDSQKTPSNAMPMGAAINFATKKYSERMLLSLTMTGQKDAENWQNAAKLPQTYYTLKAQVENILQRLGILTGNQYTAINEEARFAYGMKIHKGQQIIAQFGLLQPKLAKKMELKQAVFYAEFEWENIVKAVKKTKTTFTELPKFPSVRRDLALIIDKSISYQLIEQTIQKEAKKLLKSVNLFDVYEDQAQVGIDKKSYSVSMVFQDTEKTLVDKDIETLLQRITANLEKVGASIKTK